ncbi:MAG: arabinogalactan endo-1,4-beta-galactosidase [Caulobacter sp.]|nr:arabinogalactan endo-1,4-beta-galactosidase [Caulobacter sp.]
MKRACSFLLALALAGPASAQAGGPWFGADLSFVNEMEDCGAVYRENGARRDPYEIFKDHGANLVRIRIWNDADWTRYSNLADVKKSIRRARALGMQVLLDFHYSDTWADGDKQIIPKAWAGIKDQAVLDEALYRFTFDTLTALDADGLMPELVQVGNETNHEILGEADWGARPINWDRNASLLNAGIKAVRDAGAKSAIKPRVMLHIAQPENVEPWFEAAVKAGVTDFDQIGVSYYGKWSKYSIVGLGEVIKRLTKSYPKADVILVETAYPWTLGYKDELGNVLGEDSLIEGYPATPDGQSRYMTDVTRAVMENGGMGVVYWEPAWVSTNCKTPWGRGSSWENATFFDFNRRNALLPAIDFMRPSPAAGPTKP